MHISKSLLKEGAAYAGGRKPVLSTPILWMALAPLQTEESERKGTESTK